MKSTRSSSAHRTWAIGAAIIWTIAWLGLSSGTATAEQTTAPASKVTEQQATEIALRKVPGEVTSVSIERKGGRNVYVVEILAKEDGVETDVFVDIESGEVVGTDK